MKKRNVFTGLILLLSFMLQANTSDEDHCEAFFSYLIKDDISLFTYSFTNRSTTSSPIVASIWDFGDGESSTKSNPLHQYLNSGTYIVKLTIFTQDGCSSTYQDTIVLDVVPPPSCIASFSYYPDTSLSPYTYKFVDHSSAFQPDTVTSWTWDFDDGSAASNYQNPLHQFNNTGTYNVRLTIVTSSGCSASAQKTLVIGSPCTANFSYSQDSVNPVKYDFHDLSLPVNDVVSWRWSFGDGDTIYRQDSSHVFPYAGIYDVELKIETSTGCEDSTTITTVVGNPQRYNLWGHVYAGAFTIDHCVAYLYKSFGSYIKPIDTVRLTSVNDTLGVYYFFQQYEGEHIVKLLLPNSSAFANSFVPTYYGDELFWQNCNSLSLFSDISQATINLIKIAEPDIVSGGAGYLAGSVNNSNNPQMQKEDVEILLLNTGGQVVDYTFTDQNGSFEFTSVPFGNYLVTSDITGFDRVPVNVQLNTQSDSMTNIELFIHDQVIMGIFNEKILNVSKTDIQVYPNPSHADFSLSVTESDSYVIRITDIYGKEIWSANNQWLSKGNSLIIKLNDVAAGVYLLNLQSTDGQKAATAKIIKQ